MESCNWAFVFPGLIRRQWARTGGQGGLRPFISLGVGEGLRGQKAEVLHFLCSSPGHCPGEGLSHCLPLPHLPSPPQGMAQSSPGMVSTIRRSRAKAWAVLS